MGLPSPQEAAPPYDQVVHSHALDRFAPSGSASGYAAVAQEDHVEHDAHHHGAPSPAPPQPDSIAQTIASVFRPKPHTHCEACDVQTDARERRAQEKHCCAMVACVFMVLFISLMTLGIVIANRPTTSKRTFTNL